MEEAAYFIRVMLEVNGSVCFFLFARLPAFVAHKGSHRSCTDASWSLKTRTSILDLDVAM